MKKYFFIIIFFIFSYTVIAQEKDNFSDYLSHYKEVQLPYEMSLDSIWTIFPRNIIPKDYVLKYICEPGKPCDDDVIKYEYCYGFKINLGKYIAVILSKYCTAYDECTTEFGIGIAKYFIMVYTLDGKMMSQSVFAQVSDQHFSYVFFEEDHDSNGLLCVSTKQGTLYDYLDKINSIYKGVMDYYTYIINQKGAIKKEKNRSTNIRISWGLKGVELLKEWE